MREIIALLEKSRADALKGDALLQLKFARLVLACWPTIVTALHQLDRKENHE